MEMISLRFKRHFTCIHCFAWFIYHLSTLKSSALSSSPSLSCKIEQMGHVYVNAKNPWVSHRNRNTLNIYWRSKSYKSMHIWIRQLKQNKNVKKHNWKHPSLSTILYSWMFLCFIVQSEQMALSHMLWEMSSLGSTPGISAAQVCFYL